MSQIAIESLILLILIFANGVFALSEIAVVSARKQRMLQRAASGDGRAQVALDLAREPTRFLSTVQVGITLIGILSGAYGGATIAAQLAIALSRYPPLIPYSKGISVAIVVVVITYLSLVIGELVPKRIALADPERIATRVAPLMQTISRLATPVVHLLSVSTETVFRLLNFKPSQEPAVTEAEIRGMIFEGTRLGVFEEAEQEIMERVFRLGDRKVSSMMTYRTGMVWLDIEDPLEANLQIVISSGYSRFPVCQGSPDEVLGILHVKDLFARQVHGEEIELRTLVHLPLFIPEATRILNALEKFRQKSDQIALVVDEYGGIVGLVTLNDILVAIVGDMPSVEEQQEPQVVRREDGSLLVDGMLSVSELKELLELRDLPDEVQVGYETLAGLVMAQLGRVPVSGDSFSLGDWRMEVMDMDGYRVDKVLLTNQR
ncbi:MAG TPA: hemolysin family protein [Anaerolineales bacterium]|nr:hemolysin family protein [Anaerolineales bacterium]